MSHIPSINVWRICWATSTSLYGNGPPSTWGIALRCSYVARTKIRRGTHFQSWITLAAEDMLFTIECGILGVLPTNINICIQRSSFQLATNQRAANSSGSFVVTWQLTGCVFQIRGLSLFTRYISCFVVFYEPLACLYNRNHFWRKKLEQKYPRSI